MSPKSKDPEIDPKDIQPYIAYFNRLVGVKTDVHVNYDHDDGCSINAAIITDQGKVPLYFDTTQYDCWLLTGLFTPNDERFLKGEDLLAFHGKRFARHGGGDFVRKNDQVWTIRCPANIDALLDAYNNLARKWGKIELWH